LVGTDVGARGTIASKSDGAPPSQRSKRLGRGRYVDVRDFAGERAVAATCDQCSDALTPDGFHATGRIGSAGQTVEPLSAERVAELLAQSFDREHLRLLRHFILLHDASAQTLAADASVPLER